jgi:hypothetical protein
LHQVGDLFELNVKLRCQKVKDIKQSYMYKQNRKGSGEVQVEGRMYRKKRRNRSRRKDDCGVLTQPTYE